MALDSLVSEVKFSFLDLSAFELSDTRNDLVFLATASESAGRYEDMCRFVHGLVKFLNNEKTDLTVKERNLLSVAYKSAVGQRRGSWRTFGVDEYKDNPLVQAYKAQVESEIDAICKDVLNLLESILIPLKAGAADEGEVFYLKMAGDYYRYLAEVFADAEYDGQAAERYDQAFNVAKEKLDPTDPVRLGLVLNYSVCYYEILNDPGKACELARKAFDDATPGLSDLDENAYAEAAMILQLLKDNLTLWTSEQEQAAADDDDDAAEDA